MRWTKQEIARLKLKYSTTISWVQLKNLFPGRSKNAIKKKAKELELSREGLDKRKGFYFIFARCPIHGRILKKDVIMRGKGLNTPKCSKCNSRVKVLPRSSKLRRKYRDV